MRSVINSFRHDVTVLGVRGNLHQIRHRVREKVMDKPEGNPLRAAKVGELPAVAFLDCRYRDLGVAATDQPNFTIPDLLVQTPDRL
jgi:predicted short-subunit dehydrogenase-like oxidoreductase (DUF2520 family)